MKTIAVEKTDLRDCIERARNERIVVTRKGEPVALIVGLEGLDGEQLGLGKSNKFWSLIRQRRKEKPISRLELEEKLARGPKRNGRS